MAHLVDIMVLLDLSLRLWPLLLLSDDDELMLSKRPPPIPPLRRMSNEEEELLAPSIILIAVVVVMISRCCWDQELIEAADECEQRVAKSTTPEAFVEERGRGGRFFGANPLLTYA